MFHLAALFATMIGMAQGRVSMVPRSSHHAGPLTQPAAKPVNLKPTQATQLKARRALGVAGASRSGGGGNAAVSEAATDKEWRALSGCDVFLANNGARVDITSLWREDERVVLAFGRSMVRPDCRCHDWRGALLAHQAGTAL